MNNTTNWLRANKDVLSFNWIEQHYGIPQGTLCKVVKGTRPLPKKWIPVLEKLRKQLSKNHDTRTEAKNN